ncbi:MAG: hypothetical protein DI537_17545 [Stutzerimonas stutzeri]|nr:MAG: hypothetical protein DI537_17545 [Stutzerimonas stutzeri]
MTTETAATARKSKMYTRNLTFTQVTVGKDKKGNDYANFRADTVVKSGAKAGSTISIFGQAFGRHYAALKDSIVVGQTAKLSGYQDRRAADEAAGVTAMQSFVLIDVPAAKATPIAA